MRPWVDEMIRDQMVMMTYEYDSMKITQAEEAREEESAPPERIRDPVIQVVIVPWRRVVGDYRRAFVIVIIVYHRGIGLGLILSILARAAGHNRQAELSRETLECF